MSNDMAITLQEMDQQANAFQGVQEMQKQLNNDFTNGVDLSGIFAILSAIVNQSEQLAAEMEDTTSSSDSSTSSTSTTDSTDTSEDEDTSSDDTSSTNNSESSGMPSNEQMLFMSMESALQGRNEVIETSESNQSSDSVDDGS
ncbi:MAG: hypothetical protein AB7N99_08740 [Simkaniaceae bacterium]